MPAILSMSDAHRGLRVAHDRDDELIMMLIEMASAMVLDYMKSQSAQFLDSNGELIGEPPPQVRAATLYLVGIMYDDPRSADKFEGGRLPAPVRAILRKFRDPTLA